MTCACKWKNGSVVDLCDAHKAFVQTQIQRTAQRLLPKQSPEEFWSSACSTANSFLYDQYGRKVARVIAVTLEDVGPWRPSMIHIKATIRSAENWP